MTDEPIKIANNEPIKLESEDVFDPALTDRGANVANPDWLPGVTDPITELVGAFKELMPVRAELFKPPNLEHKVRIYAFNDSMNREEVRAEVEALLNDGYSLNFPSVICNEYAMLDFARRIDKEEEDDGEQ
jgi:hypothetical protein